MGVLNGAGVLEKITNGILNSKMGKTVRGAEFAMMLGISFTTLIFGGVTSASMTTFGKVQNEIGKRVGLPSLPPSQSTRWFCKCHRARCPVLECFCVPRCFIVGWL